MQAVPVIWKQKVTSYLLWDSFEVGNLEEIVLVKISIKVFASNVNEEI